jgi:hypothetical protein
VSGGSKASQQKEKTMGLVITGYEAIGMKQNDDAVVLIKYADPTDGVRVNITVEEALDIADEDPSLIWCEI